MQINEATYCSKFQKILVGEKKLQLAPSSVGGMLCEPSVQMSTGEISEMWSLTHQRPRDQKSTFSSQPPSSSSFLIT